jgi:hypothetical protein
LRFTDALDNITLYRSSTTLLTSKKSLAHIQEKLGSHPRKAWLTPKKSLVHIQEKLVLTEFSKAWKFGARDFATPGECWAEMESAKWMSGAASLSTKRARARVADDERD